MPLPSLSLKKFTSAPSLRVILWGNLMVASFVWMACSGSKNTVDHQTDCRKRFDELHEKFEKSRWQAVRDGYSEFITTCTGFEFSEQAYYEMAEAYFQQGDAIEAEAEFRSFVKEYPNSVKYAEKARYRIAQASAMQVSIAARDQSKTIEAISEYETFIEEFDESTKLDSAKSEVQRLKGLLAEKVLQTARLYRRMGEPQASAIYYKQALKEWGDRLDTRRVTLELAQCYIDLYQFEEAENHLRGFDGIAKDDAFHLKVKEAYAKLEKARKRLAKEKQEEKEEAQRDKSL